MKQVHQKNACLLVKVEDVYVKDVGFKFEPHVCNKRHDVLMTASELKNIAILSPERVDFRRIFWGISRDETVNRRLIKVSYKRILVQIKRLWTGVIREGAFGGTYFGNIYFSVTGKWYKISWKEFN